MANRASPNRPTEFSNFADIDAGTLAAVEHDLSTDSVSATEIMKRFAQVNSGMAITILAKAREAKEMSLDPEIASLNGALLVLGALDKLEKAKSLDAMFVGNTSNMPDTTATIYDVAS